MAWSNILTPSYLRNIVGNTDNTRDLELLTYINALVADLEYLTGLNFDFTNDTVTKTIRYQAHKNTYVLGGGIVQIGAWQSIATVETSAIQMTPSWQTLTLDEDYLTITHKTQPNPIFQIEPICQNYQKYSQIRITGVEGFGNANEVPNDLALILANLVNSYYTYLINGATGQFANSEKDLTSSITYENSQLQSPQLFAGMRIQPFLSIAQKYNVNLIYPF
jgi:hypothetical protein